MWDIGFARLPEMILLYHPCDGRGNGGRRIRVEAQAHLVPFYQSVRLGQIGHEQWEPCSKVLEDLVAKGIVKVQAHIGQERPQTYIAGSGSLHNACRRHWPHTVHTLTGANTTCKLLIRRAIHFMLWSTNHQHSSWHLSHRLDHWFQIPCWSQAPLIQDNGCV